MFSDFPEDNSFFLDAGMQAASEHLGGKKDFYVGSCLVSQKWSWWLWWLKMIIDRVYDRV